MRRLAVFDLDGTLLNTLEDLAGAGNHLLAAHGLPTHPLAAYRYFVGNGVLKLVERMVPEDRRGDREWILALRDEYSAYYQLHSEEKTAPYEGVLELLDALRARGLALAVLTNKPHAVAVPLCERMFGDRFALVLGQREGRPTKPDASLTAEVLAATGFSASEALYVGDSSVDMQTAKNGGIFAVGALWGFRTAEELLQNGADALAERPAELLRFVE